MPFTPLTAELSAVFTAALGIRMDASKTTVKSIGNEDPEDDAVYTRDTVNFYPSAHFTYRLDGSNSFMLAYSRRVARPDTQPAQPQRRVHQSCAA